MSEIRYVKVYPRLYVAKGCALVGIGYMCYKVGKLVQKVIDNYHPTISFNKKDKTQK